VTTIGTRTSTRAQRVVITLALLLAGVGWSAPVAHASPVTGRTSVIKCQFKDNTEHNETRSPVNTDAQIADFLINRGTGSLADYYEQVSDGQISLAGSDISGWYTLPLTVAEDRALGGDRGRRILDCAAAAQAAGWTLPPGNQLIVFRNQCIDGGSWSGRVLIDPCSDLAFTAHEFGHALGRDHSMSDDLTARFGGGPGEYDDEWDLMSAMHVDRGPGTGWTSQPVGFNAFNRSMLGLIPAGRILTWPAHSAGQATLTPLYGSPATSTLPLMVKIPLAPGDTYEYLTVEYRAPQGLDAPIGPAVVQIHGVNGNRSWLFRVTTGRNPTQHIVIGTTAVDVTSTGGPTATVSVDPDHLLRVPDLVGATRADATRAVLAAGLAVSLNTRVEPTCAHLGQVIEQQPDAGSVVERGSRVLLTLAGHRGPCPIE